MADTFCNLDTNVEGKTSGSDVVVAIYDSTGTYLYAIGGQTEAGTDMSREKIDATDKLGNGWKASFPGTAEWTKDIEGLTVKNDAGQARLNQAFRNGQMICVKTLNQKTGEGIEGGVGWISKFSQSHPSDDLVSWSATIEGVGELVDLENAVGDLPIGVTIPISDLVATQGASAGQIALAFSAPTGATSVAVQTRTGNSAWVNATTVAAITAALTSAVVNNLTTGASYSVRMVVTGGTKAGISNESNAIAK